MRHVSLRLEDVLDKCNVTAYRLAQVTEGRLSRTAIYRLINHPPLRIEMETIATLLDAFDELDCDVKLADLFEVKRGK